ncbi:NADP-dependent mannitol dehydrogenase [Scleroderma citrinum]
MSSSQGLPIKLKGCVVITGGTRGIGLCYSHAVAQAGANLALIFRERRDDANKAVDEIQKKYRNIKVKAYQCDVSDLEGTTKTFREIEEDREMGGVTGLMANAGRSVVKPALELSPEDFHLVYNTNVLGVFNTARAAAKIFQDHNRPGAIVITGSMSAKIINQSGPNKPLTQVFYNSSKAAVINLTKGLAAEWAPKIRVNSVSPGYVDTEQTRHMNKDIIKHQEHNVPLRRFAEPHEIAGQAVFLLSDHASYMTGSDVILDGGQLIW